MPQDRYNGERVLVVPTLLFHEIGLFQGFHADVDRYLSTLLDPSYTKFLSRAEAEEDPSYKQLIPYCLFRHGGRFYSYRRGGSGGEGRLHGRRSLGIGGHISEEDAAGSNDPYRAGMLRELGEEVRLDGGYRERVVGLINDDSVAVGRVHLGVVHLFDLDAPQVLPLETSIQGLGFAPPEELAAARDEFETWSQICLDWLAAGAESRG